MGGAGLSVAAPRVDSTLGADQLCMQDSLEGLWLNLDANPARAAVMQEQLCALGLQRHYSRFTAYPGDPEHAAARGLRVGEEGAWRSWLAMLDRARCSSADVVHLLEDDVAIGPPLLKLLAWQELDQHLAHSHWLSTDAFVSPGQVRQLLPVIRATDAFVVVTRGFRVPCLSSIIARPHRLSDVVDALRSLWEASGPLRPVDVALGDLVLQDRLVFGSVVPFVTGPILDLARVSSIRDPAGVQLERSREVLSLLRRVLLAGHDHQILLDEWSEVLRCLDRSEQQDLILDVVDGFVERGLIGPY